MKKILIIIVSALLLITLCGCKSEITADDVSKAIADIYSDGEGNVTIALSDGREFNLGNMKGEKGDKGDKGDPGINGTDGKDGINGKDGVDGKDGANGSDGKDGTNATPITDYVKDVTFTDENMLTIEYGDGSKSEVSRIDLEGQYILKTYVKLYDLNDNYLDTILTDYFCYEEGQKLKFSISFPLMYDDKYFELTGYDDLSNEIANLEGSGSPGGINIEGVMPGRNIDYYIKAKQLGFNPVGEIKFTSSDINDVKTTLDSFGITYRVLNGDASLADCGKVQKVSITAINGQTTKELNINGEGWSSNFLGANATIYTYKEPTLSVLVIINNNDKITRFTAIYNGIDDVNYTWYDGDSEIGTGKDYSVPESQTMNSIKLVVKSGDKILEASYPGSN